jgi:hypothetical protein
MTYPDPSERLFGFFTEDVSGALVDEQLALQHKIGLFMRISLLEWDVLEKDYGNLRHFISITANELGQGDPLLTERAAASLLGLVLMLDKDLGSRSETITGVQPSPSGDAAVSDQLPAV